MPPQRLCFEQVLLTGVGVGLGVFKSASNEASEFEKSMITLGIISEIWSIRK